MMFCENCGAQADGARFCPKCGTPAKPSSFVGGGATERAQPATTGDQPMGPTAQQGYAVPVVPGAPQQADIRDAQDNKTMAILAYLLFFIPLLSGAHKTSEFARYHTNQGTVLFLAALIYGIAYAILTAVLVFIPVVGWILIVILGLLSILFLALCIVGILNAANGRMRPLPVIGGITVIKATKQQSVPPVSHG